MRRVFVNGCFDILHIGHLRLLQYASSLGKLTVAVNTDDSIHRLKGDGRPVNRLADRMDILRAFSCVHRVLSFKDTTPNSLLHDLFTKGEGPDYVVKGADYEHKEFMEKGLLNTKGCVIVYFGNIQGYSTTAMIHHEREQAVLEHERLEKESGHEYFVHCKCPLSFKIRRLS